jgi:hypothetical protein
VGLFFSPVTTWGKFKYNTYICNKMKWQFGRALDESAAYCGCEVWAMKEEENNKLLTVEMGCSRRNAKLLWIGRI